MTRQQALMMAAQAPGTEFPANAPEPDYNPPTPDPLADLDEPGLDFAAEDRAFADAWWPSQRLPSTAVSSLPRGDRLTAAEQKRARRAARNEQAAAKGAIGRVGP